MEQINTETERTLQRLINMRDEQKRSYSDFEAERQALRNHVAEYVEIILKKRGVPKRYLAAKLENFSAGVRKLSELQEGLYLHGPCGVGKTFLAVALMREAILKTEPVKKSPYGDALRMPYEQMPWFINVPDLLLEIKESFQEGSEISERQVIEKYSRYETLILDDLGAEKVTDWVLQTLYTIINRRNVELRRTIFT